MSSILDVDLDYFHLFDEPVAELDRLLGWAARPVDLVVEHHHEAFKGWKRAVRQGAIETPRFILHVDEHHDMLGERGAASFGNFLYFAMRQWPDCRVHWLVKDAIDSPDLWLSEDTWALLAERFTLGKQIPSGWPKPDLVSVCASPGFLDERLSRELVRRIRERARR